MELSSHILILIAFSSLLSAVDAICVPIFSHSALSNASIPPVSNVADSPQPGSAIPNVAFSDAPSPAPIPPISYVAGSPAPGSVIPEVTFSNAPSPAPIPPVSYVADSLSLESNSPASAMSIGHICAVTAVPKVCVESITPFLRYAPSSAVHAGILAVVSGIQDAIAKAKELTEDPSQGDSVLKCLMGCQGDYNRVIDNSDSALKSIDLKDFGMLKTALNVMSSHLENCGGDCSDEQGIDSPMKSTDEEIHTLIGNCIDIANSFVH